MYSLFFLDSRTSSIGIANIDHELIEVFLTRPVLCYYCKYNCLTFIYDPATTTSMELFLLRFSSNSEAYASELLEHLEEMFSLCYKRSDVCS